MWRSPRLDPGAGLGEGSAAVFVGATRYSGPLAWVRLAPKWFAMVKQMRRMPGYVSHGVYYEPPWTLGTLGFFTADEDLSRFARTGEHRELMQWVVGGQKPGDRRNATGGYIRIYALGPDRPGEADPDREPDQNDGESDSHAHQ